METGRGLTAGRGAAASEAPTQGALATTATVAGSSSRRVVKSSRKAISPLALGLASVLACAAVAVPATAGAQDQVAKAEAATPVPVAPRALPKLGIMVDAGVPDGAQAALVVRPASWVRLHAGGGYNLISKGINGGVALIPFGSGPSFTIEGGRYFDGDANGVARKFAGSAFQDQAVLQRVGYDYANAHLGLELGKQRFTFFLHAGMSYVRATVHNLNTQIGDSTSANGSGTSVTFGQDPIVKAMGPSLKLGFILYLS